MKKILFFVLVASIFWGCSGDSQKKDSKNMGEVSDNVPLGINEQAPQIDTNNPPIPVGE